MSLPRLLVNGRLVLIGGRVVPTDCPSCCSTTCPTVWVARACRPDIENPPDQCDYVAPADLLICTTTTCSSGAPLSPGTTVIVSGQCYTIVGSPIPSAGQQNIYQDPTIQCVPSCSHPGCGTSPYSRARSCRPEAPPLWYCRAQIQQCFVARICFGGGTDAFCYEFRPDFPASSPPPGSFACSNSPGPCQINLPSGCRVIDFGGVRPIDPDAITDCCECQSPQCNHVEAATLSSIPPTVNCNPLPVQNDHCCPPGTPDPAQRIRVRAAVSQFFPAFNFTTSSTVEGDLTVGGLPNPTGATCAGNDPAIFSGLLTQTFFNNGIEVGSQQVEAVCCFCPLTRVVGNSGQFEVLPQPNCESQGGTCLCLSSGYSATRYFGSWRFTTDEGNVTTASWDVRAIFPSSPPAYCLSGCRQTFTPQPSRPPPIGIIPAPTGPLPAEGSGGGTITVRGGGSRQPPPINVVELL